MAAATKIQLDVEDLKSQEVSDSDSDSGQGSCEMTSPTQINKGVASVDGEDSDEEIYVTKRVKCKKFLPDSDSEREDLAPEKSEAATGDMESMKENDDTFAAKEKKSNLIFQALQDSDDDDEVDNLFHNKNLGMYPELGLSEHKLENSGKKHKNHRIHCIKEIIEKEKGAPRKRRKEKEEKMKAIRDTIKKGEAEEGKEDSERFSFNDSGCLLADKDLFENGLEEEDPLLQDEESLELIKTAGKEKVKKRKERKAAKLGKEAIKQLHSETQRLVREANIPLPYHLPEAKSVHEFFKRKPRPAFQGSAMTLLKSTKYQPSLDEESPVPKNPGIDCSESWREQFNQSAVRVLAAGLDLQASAPLNPASASTDETSTGEVGNLAKYCLEENEQGSDSKIECLKEELSSGKQEKPGQIPAECIKSVENEVEENLLEQVEAQSSDLGGKPKDIVKPQEAVLLAPAEKTKKSKLDRLRELGVDLTIKPRLCSGDDSFINLDEPESNRELDALKERFVKHALYTTKPKAERTVGLNIIRKETTHEGKEELKADVVAVTLAAETVEGATHAKPGEKLQMLKAQLQEVMKLRRMEERQKRQALYKLDNEDMAEEEEEEEEMTDESEEEEEEGNQETVEYLLGETEEDNEELEEQGPADSDKETDKESVDEERAANFVHCTAVPKLSSTESTLLLFKDNSSKTGCFLPSEKAEVEEAVGRSHKPEDEDSFLLPNLAKENSHNSSFELIGSMIPSYQPCNKQLARGGNFLSAIGVVRSPSPGFFKTSFISSASKSSGKASEPSLPIEDSQDLYNATPEEKSPVPTAGRFQFQFSLEDDTQSQLLDADGFLNVGHHRNKYQSSKDRLPLASMDENAMDANMDELLDLCSGQFASQNKCPPDNYHGKKQNMEELLNLCSGKFASQNSPIRSSSANPKLEKENSTDDPMAEAVALCSGSFSTGREVEEDEEDEFGDFCLLTDDHAFDSEEDEKNKEEEDDEQEEEKEGETEEEESEDEVEDDDDEEEVLRRREGMKKKFKLQDFMEEEAELSGSEMGSEDEYDGEELDVYEDEVLDEVLPTDAELQDQVNKIHMKVMLDDDKRQLRLYQERYLADGDLHSDGPGRMRKFRWKNIDDAFQQDMFHNDAENDDDENEDHLDETEAKWRKERFEREQWLREQSEKGEEEDIDENSQFMKLAKKVTVKSLQKKATPSIAVQEAKSLPRNPFETFRSASDPQLKNGSLLNRPKAVLQKLAAMSDLNPNAPRNSRNFVFQTLSPVKSEETKEKSKPQVKKRAPVTIATPSPKRPRIDGTSAQETRSIFQYLER
ncbi:claspin [Zootoca vivipara]|uniref:claspin n=1 Tax=Zootoca vivipara TaxID=8524 RepID=UPI00293B9DFA|nr:claspin [Zootoca vivipara]